MTEPGRRRLVAKTFPGIRRVKRYVTSVQIGADQIPLPTYTVAQWMVVVVVGFVSWVAWKKFGLPWQAALFLMAGSFIGAAAMEKLPIPKRALWPRFEGYIRLRLFWWVQFATTRPRWRGKL